ncbi:LacI family DNA-binding transcriptional regulator [Arthrobacter sp. RIT-PI-e]|uniref:LacI family DNA-binding transcriptional regulator n=1 Tax=Arthrobacter sp. RIT-PI-e TaxID=1681197 RepID=UPI0009E2F7E7|nr:LacI family DNA-binding transcriptional regulator [Arthrobacter sp. RIT-PI-e]
MANTSRPATIVDVARVAGVSRQTVSRAMNGLPDISAETRERVIEAARTLKYRPNRAAQGLVRGRETTIGFVVEDLQNPYYPELASALSRIAGERGWTVMLCDVGQSMESASAQLTSLVRRVDALVITGCQGGSVGAIPVSTFKQSIVGIPTVILDGSSEDAFDAYVSIDHRAGVVRALDHLVGRGRRHIAMIDTLQMDSLRRDSYRDYLVRHDLAWTEDSEVRVEETLAGGITAATTLMERYPQMDAILAYNDILAIGALKGLGRSGVQVPESISVMGIDGLAVGAMVTPELTTLAIDKTELARHAIELLDDIVSSSAVSGAGASRTLQYELTLRGSS